MTEKLPAIFNRLNRSQAWWVIVLYVVATIVIGLAATHYINREALRLMLQHADGWATPVFVVIEYLYIVLVPFYNVGIHLAAGYIFGGNVGWLLNWITANLGLFTIVWLIKRYGRPLLEKVVSQEFLAKFDKFDGKIPPILLFVIYALPFFPDNEFAYIVAAGSGSFSPFILPIILGNIAKASISFIGDKGWPGFWQTGVIRLEVLILGSIVVIIQELIRKDAIKKKLIKEKPVIKIPEISADDPQP